MEATENISAQKVRHYITVQEASGGFFVQLNQGYGEGRPCGEWVFSSPHELHNGLQTIAQLIAPELRPSA